MENEHFTIFKPFQEVLVRNNNNKWQAALYSHSEELPSGKKVHRIANSNNGFFEGEIIDYNRHKRLLGTTFSTDDVFLLPGDIIVVFDRNRRPTNTYFGTTKVYDSIDKNGIKVKTEEGIQYYQYCIPYTDFNPANVKDSLQYTLRAVEGKLIACPLVYDCFQS